MMVHPPVACNAAEDPARERARLAVQAVRRLALRNFRNYAALRLDLDAGPVVLHGENGAGKTNLLEAVSLMAPGRGLRRARLADIDRKPGGGFAIEAVIDGVNGPTEITTTHEPDNERRSVQIDGSAARSSMALGHEVGIVWLTPALDRVFLEGPSGRRRLLDRLVLAIHPDHGTQVSACERAMRDRAVLLRERRGDAVWLGALERRMAESAIAVAAARRDVTHALNALLADHPTAFPTPVLSVCGDLEEWLATMPAVDAEHRLAEALAASRPLDAHQGGASHGPHRSDLEVRMASTGMPAADCSTGQQKSLLVSIVLAEASLYRLTRGSLPILLLDEIVAHLDATRRRELFEIITGLGAQAWLTGTDADLFAPLRGAACFHRVSEATLRLDE